MARLGRANKRRMSGKAKAKKNFSSKQVKTIKTIAKRVTNSLAETKFFVYNGQLEPGTGSLTSYNLFYHGVTRGSGNNQFDGDKLNWRGICIKYQIENYYTDVTSQWNIQPFDLTFMIVETPTYKTTTSLTQAELQNDTTANFGLGFFDNDVKVLKVKKVSFKLPFYVDANDPRMKKTGKIWLKRSQMLNFVDFQQNYNLGRKNYYMLVYANGSAGGTVGHIDFVWQNYFKDS